MCPGPRGATNVALLAMAVAEVLGRTLVMATRRRRLAHSGVSQPRTAFQNTIRPFST